MSKFFRFFAVLQGFVLLIGMCFAHAFAEPTKIYANTVMTNGKTVYITQDGKFVLSSKLCKMSFRYDPKEHLYNYDATPVLLDVGCDIASVISVSTDRLFFITKDGTIRYINKGVDEINTDGAEDIDYMPVKHLDGTDNCVKYISALSFHLILKSDGTVWGSGDNRRGQLGLGYWGNPDKVNINYGAIEDYRMAINLPRIVDICAETDDVMALGSDGMVYTWGSNNYGQIGDGTHSGYVKGVGATDNSRATPIKVENLSDVVQIACNYRRSFALKNDGTVWSWGDYDNEGYSLTPTKMEMPGKVVQISATWNRYAVLLEDGSVWRYIVDTDTSGPKVVSTSRFEKVENLPKIKYIDGGTTVLDEDGNIWRWGNIDISSFDYDPSAYDPYSVNSGWMYRQEKPLLFTTPQVLALGTVKSPFDDPFTASDWALEELSQAGDLIPDGMDTCYQFKITRAEFCNLAVELIEQKSGLGIQQFMAGKGYSQANKFNDSADEKVLIAGGMGIVNGKGGNMFDPHGYITRQEAATMLYRTAKVLGYDLQNPGSGFADNKQIASWAVEAVGYVSSAMDGDKAVMQGLPSNRFDPKGYYTREQAYITAKRLFNAG